MPGRYTLALLAALVLLALAGCGGSSDSGATETVTAGVPEEQIDKAASQTPQHTVLQWWHDVQVNDPGAARSLYAVAPTLPNLAGQFNLVAGKLDGKVSIVSAKPKDGRTLVRVRWQPEGEPTREVTLRLSKEGGTWKLLDTRFLDEMVAELQSSEAG
jgi:hypothetical protein